MMQTVSIPLTAAAREMAQEEILKQLAYISQHVRRARFSADGCRIECDVPAAGADELVRRIQVAATRTQRSLRALERRVIHRTERPVDFHDLAIPGLHWLGFGQVAIDGLALRVFRYFERIFTEFGECSGARALVTPTLIPTPVLSRCDYFRSFPHYVTFASHLRPEADVIDDFRVRHQTRDDLDELTIADLQLPEACLAPALCYHVYHRHDGETIPATGLTYSMTGKCFRYESGNTSDLRRLWDFTMNEVVFLGSREQVLERRRSAIEHLAALMDAHDLAGEIRTASDPFFIEPNAAAKTYFQLSSETKYELSALLPAGERLAIGSLNYHTDFFGRAFNVTLESGGAMHSVCVGFGLERWVHAFVTQHGIDIARWPSIVREAPEFASERRRSACPAPRAAEPGGSSPIPIDPVRDRIVPAGNDMTPAAEVCLRDGSHVTASPPRIRVVHLVMTLNIGGLERVVLDLVRHTADRFECSVMCLEEIGALGPEFAAAGIAVECIGSPASGPLRNVWSLARRLRALRPDVLHTHNVKPHVQGTLAAVLARVPAVMSTKHGQHHAETRVAGMVSRWACRRAASLVGVSADAARIWRDTERAADGAVSVIYNGIDLDAFRVPAERTSEAMLRAVTVARLSPVKDQATLLRAVRDVVDREPRFTLDIVGDGPCRADLEALAARLRLERHVRFRGVRSDIATWLASAGVFVLSSQSEGVPLTVLEAMAAGLPVVSTDVGGVAEVVIDGRTGVLVPPERPDALAAAILRVVGDADVAREMGRAGRARAELAFDVGAMCRHYESLYLNALDRRRDARRHAVATDTRTGGFATHPAAAAGPIGVRE